MPTSSGSTEVDADRRWLPVGLLAVGVATAILLALVGRTRLGGGVWTLHDLGVYWWGGGQVGTGRLYADAFPASQLIPAYQGPDLPFTYTPVAALVFVPLAWLPWGVAQVVIVVGNVAALVALVLGAMRALGARFEPGRVGFALVLAAAALLAEPVATNLALGQINLVLAVVCLLDLSLPATSRAKGIGIGLAAAIKLTPALFLVLLFLTGERRAALRSVLTLASVNLVAFALLPAESWSYWFEGVFRDARRIGRVTYVGNQSIHGVVSRLFGPGGLQWGIWLVAAAIVLVAGLGAAVAWHRAGHRLGAALLVALVTLLVSPIAWTHHWVWIVPGAVLALDGVGRGVPWTRRLLLAGAVVFAAPGILWRLPRDNDVERGWNGVEVVVGNLYVWVGLAAVALAVALRPRPDRAVSAGSPGRPARARPRGR